MPAFDHRRTPFFPGFHHTLGGRPPRRRSAAFKTLQQTLGARWPRSITLCPPCVIPLLSSSSTVSTG